MLDEIYGYFTWLLSIIFWLILSLLFALWWCQGLLLYLPLVGVDPKTKNRAVSANISGYQSPAEYSLDFEDVSLLTADGASLHAWFIKRHDYQHAPTVIFFHGNAGNIGYRLPLIHALHDHVQCNVLALQYRGYGSSSGTPSERGLTIDAQTGLNWLHARNDIDKTRIFVYGQSLGGAVTIKLASLCQDRLAGIMVENTFTSIDDMVIELGQKEFGLHWLHHLRLFFAFFITNHWYSVKSIATIKLPILFLSGQKDELIPPAQMQALHDASRNSSMRRYIKFDNGHHNDTYMRGARYFPSMAEFVHDVVSGETTYDSGHPSSSSIHTKSVSASRINHGGRMSQ